MTGYEDSIWTQEIQKFRKKLFYSKKFGGIQVRGRKKKKSWKSSLLKVWKSIKHKEANPSEKRLQMNYLLLYMKRQEKRRTKKAKKINMEKMSKQSSGVKGESVCGNSNIQV